MASDRAAAVASSDCVDILLASLGVHAFPERPKIRVLDLYSGTGSVSKVCQRYPLLIDSVSLDYSTKYSTPTYVKDVMKFDYKAIAPFDIIFASPDCSQFSCARTTGGPRDLKKAIRIIHKTLEIIAWFALKNDKLVWFIENPATGLLVRDIGRYKVPTCMKNLRSKMIQMDYCMFSGFGYQKQTAFFTNLRGCKSKMCYNCRDCGNKNGKVHKRSVTTVPHDQKISIPGFLIHTLLFMAIRQVV